MLLHILLLGIYLCKDTGKYIAAALARMSSKIAYKCSISLRES